MSGRGAFCLLLIAVMAALLCPVAAAQPVVVYTAVDEPIARPILEKFQRDTGITVTIVTDAEAAKTAGLAARLEAEKANPQADVWWGNEVFYTINLAQQGVLAPYQSPAAEGIPAQFRDPQARWHGAGLRARVIAAGAGMQIDELSDLADPQLKGRIGIARPTAGTTGGHMAALYVLWGEQRADEFLRSLQRNEVRVLGGNGQVAEQVARGALRAGLTDNDDIVNAQREIGPLEQVLPDQNAAGTLMMPTTVALVAGAPHPETAKRMIDYLLSPPAEQALKDAGFAMASVRDAKPGGSVRAMQVDFAAVAQAMPQAIRRATAILEGRE